MSLNQSWDEVPCVACVIGGSFKSKMNSMLFCKVKVILQKQVRASAREGCAITVLSFSWLHCTDNGCLAVDSDIGIELLEGSKATGINLCKSWYVQFSFCFAFREFFQCTQLFKNWVAFKVIFVRN